MCLIAFINNKESFTEKEFRTAWVKNPDGFGLIEITENKVTKELSYNKALATYLQASPPLLLHFRAATHGKIDVNNCHPFPFPENGWFMHNGILQIFSNWKNSKSDTSQLSEFLLKNSFSFKQAIELLKVLNKSGGGKFAIVKDKKVELIGDFLKEKDNYYSNYSFKPFINMLYKGVAYEYYRI